MSGKDVDKDSDDSDEDYVPEGENPNLSEEEESGDAESDNDETGEPRKKKRKAMNEDEKELETPVIAEESKLDGDSLWADFKKDVDKTKSDETTTKPSLGLPKPETNNSPLPTKPSSVRPILGNTSKGGGGGLASVLSQLGKKNKLSTLEKSKQDWNNFKRSEGIEEELTSHNKGKDGFLQRRDFLERTDIRQFEIEKELRAVKRSNR